MISKLTSINAEPVIPAYDEGFGRVAAYKDPDGNHFEIVELDCDFQQHIKTHIIVNDSRCEDYRTCTAFVNTPEVGQGVSRFAIRLGL